MTARLAYPPPLTQQQLGVDGRWIPAISSVTTCGGQLVTDDGSLVGRAAIDRADVWLTVQFLTALCDDPDTNKQQPRHLQLVTGTSKEQ